MKSFLEPFVQTFERLQVYKTKTIPAALLPVFPQEQGIQIGKVWKGLNFTLYSIGRLGSKQTQILEQRVMTGVLPTDLTRKHFSVEVLQ